MAPSSLFSQVSKSVEIQNLFKKKKNLLPFWSQHFALARTSRVQILSIQINPDLAAPRNLAYAGLTVLTFPLCVFFQQFLDFLKQVLI